MDSNEDLINIFEETEDEIELIEEEKEYNVNFFKNPLHVLSNDEISEIFLEQNDELLIFDEEESDEANSESSAVGSSTTITDDDEENEKDNEETEQEDEQEERPRGRGRPRRVRGRERGRPRGRPRGRGRGRGGNEIEQEDNENENEQEREMGTELPLPPQFEKFYHSNPLHKASINLPQTMYLSDESCTPYLIFSLFFSSDIFDIIVNNTNEYAASKLSEGGRPWQNLTLSELRIFIAMLIYMGIFKLPSTRDYWKNKYHYPKHNITKFMTCLRFEQIKRYLHISSITDQDNKTLFSKLEPLSTHIKDISQKHYIPSSNVSVDEMIARFSGRSSHTFRIKNKPTPEGYKIFSLCDAGYTYSFLFLSRTLKNPIVNQIPNLNYTSCQVYHLIKQLPLLRSFNIYMDNYFSNINLFKFLRDHNYGACGTVRTNSSKFPNSLKIKKKLDWDTLSGVVVDQVLSVLWIDNGPVTMLSTIHEIDNGLQNRIIRERRRPRINTTNSSTIKRVFGDNSKKELPIPKIIDDYNHFMGGVDIADQYRSSYIIQFPVQRIWVPLFFWLLDTSIINSYLIYKIRYGKKANHKNFRLSIVLDLIKEAIKNQSAKETRSKGKGKKVQNLAEKSYITKNFELLPDRLAEAKHLPVYNNNNLSCEYCKILNKLKGQAAKKSPSKTHFSCSFCNVRLCINNTRNCYHLFHTITDNELNNMKE
jgi:hypothetical protein